ncbi:hypothetical protein [Myxococcus qinghaiensis]|uniref:hypothetical protein n=1 Tax=Myxococcus qinghaiensis TaxID=2906758 RepID=UPI0020A76066|nr:hypothetical protein [Myxococcus qinghaiensis]MCP3169072.1 hypothetical protein [Myxococcus qinghaiensis]
MSSPVSFFLIPPEGLAGVLTRARLAAMRSTVAEGLEDPEEDDDEVLLLELMDHLSQHGADTLTRLPERLEDGVWDLLDVLADELVHLGEDARGEPLELATQLHPSEYDVQAAEAVVGASCAEPIQRLWRFAVWGRLPGQDTPTNTGLKRAYPALGYWTGSEVRQLREGLREHLEGAPDYKPHLRSARIRSWLQRKLTLARRGDPARALDAATHALDKASRQGLGLLFAR